MYNKKKVSSRTQLKFRYGYWTAIVNFLPFQSTICIDFRGIFSHNIFFHWFYSFFSSDIDWLLARSIFSCVLMVGPYSGGTFSIMWPTTSYWITKPSFSLFLSLRLFLSLVLSQARSLVFYVGCYLTIYMYLSLSDYLSTSTNSRPLFYYWRHSQHYVTSYRLLVT